MIPKDVTKIVGNPKHLRRTGAIALAVGTWLTVVNQGDTLLSTGLAPALAGKIVLNYLTPLVVSNLGLLSRHAPPHMRDVAPKAVVISDPRGHR